MKLKIKFEYSYLISILTSFIILCYFAYKGIIAYLIHKELYGGGVDVVITLRGIISFIMLFFIFLQIQFLKIKDLKSHKKILSGIFVVWTSIFFSTIIVSREEIIFLIITFITSVLILLSLLSLREQIKEARNTLVLHFTTNTCSMVILSVVRETEIKKVTGLRVSAIKEKASAIILKASL